MHTHTRTQTHVCARVCARPAESTIITDNSKHLVSFRLHSLARAQSTGFVHVDCCLSIDSTLSCRYYIVSFSPRAETAPIRLSVCLSTDDE